ncbi:hypothetical protein [Pseudomonas phage D6]|nr:hypothetical protein [Pseudomonas phage D6]
MFSQARECLMYIDDYGMLIKNGVGAKADDAELRLDKRISHGNIERITVTRIPKADE